MLELKFEFQLHLRKHRKIDLEKANRGSRVSVVQTSPEEPQFIPDFDNVMGIRLVIVIQENKTIIVTHNNENMDNSSR